MALENFVNGTMLNNFAKKLKSNIKSDLLGDKKLRYLTQAEYDLLTDDEKNDENIIYNITDADIEEGLSGDYNDLLNQPINSLPVHSYSSNNRIIFVEVMSLEKNKWYKLDPKDAIESNSSLTLAHFFEDGTFKNFSAVTGGYAYSLFFVQAKGTNTITLRQLDTAGGFFERKITIGADSASTTSTLVPLSLSTINEKEFIPTKDYHPATKQYVDNAITGSLKVIMLSQDQYDALGDNIDPGTLYIIG